MESFDETAGRFAVYRTTIHDMHMQQLDERVELETEHCSVDHYKQFGVSNYDILQNAGFGLGECMKDPAQAELEGDITARSYTFLEFNIFKCVQEDLPVGKTCMDDDQLKEYLAPMAFIMTTIFNFVDYSDI